MYRTVFLFFLFLGTSIFYSQSSKTNVDLVDVGVKGWANSPEFN